MVLNRGLDAPVMCQCPRVAGAVADAPAAPPRPAPAPRTVVDHLGACATAVALWALICAVPLGLAHRYERIWPAAWYAHDPAADATPSPLGLSLGILAVAVGQVWVLGYQFARWRGSTWCGPLRRIQPNEVRDYAYGEGAASHLAQPEGFALIGGYLSLTWLLRLMPRSYYGFAGGIHWGRVAACLLVQDALQYAAHRLEHKASKALRVAPRSASPLAAATRGNFFLGTARRTSRTTRSRTRGSSTRSTGASRTRAS